MKQYLLSDNNINEISSKVKNKNIILFLDYDGTLAPFAENPDNATPLTGIIETIEKINKSKNVYVTIISGRTLSSLNKLINIPNLNYVGTHGLEYRFAKKDNKISESDKHKSTDEKIKNLLNNILESTKDVLPKIRSYFEYLKNNHHGVEYEDKKYTLTLHHSPSYQIGRVMEYLESTIRNTQLEIIKGRNIIEVRPSGWNKGKAVEFILENILNKEIKQSEKDYLTIYIGDDTTDEDAFNVLSGINVYVKNEDDLQTAADFYLYNPKDVLTFLDIIGEIL